MPNGLKRYSRTEPLLTVKKFKQQYLFGVDLRDSQGKIISDEVIGDFINFAIDYVEMELNVPILPKDITYDEDYDLAAYRQFNFIQLPYYPIVSGSVTKIDLRFSDTIKIEFPPEWFKIYEAAGQVSLLPNVSTLSSVLIAQAGQLLPRAIHSQKAPQLLRVKYKAGIADINDKVPPVINKAIGLSAALYLLQMIGDIGPGGSAGISSQTLSIDGMTQTINTSISATNNLYGATIEPYKKQLEKVILPLLKRRYKRLHVEFI